MTAADYEQTTVSILWNMMTDAERREFIREAFRDARPGETVFRYDAPIDGYACDWRRITSSDGY